MYRATTFRLIWLLSFFLVVTGCERRQHLVEQQLLEFGTIIEITMISTDLTRAEQLLSEIEHRLRVQRNQWHAWEDSDLTRFNLALQQNSTAEVPASLAHLLQLSHRYYEITDGLFNPALGKLIAAHGFHGGQPNADMIAEIKRDVPDMQDLRFESNLAFSSNPHLQIDFGGIAKGFAVGLVSNYLDNNGIDDYIINAGGDMALAGSRFGRPWRIGIQNPYTPGIVARIAIEGKHSLFTSGNYQRRYLRGDDVVHHIIDPRSGEPSRGSSSVTVLNPDPVLADVAATSLMIDGPSGSHSLAKALQVNDFLVIRENREIEVSRSFADKIEITVPWPITIIN